MRIRKNIFLNITCTSFIAGESVVYAMNNFVPEKSIENVDFFILDEDWDNFNRLIDILKICLGRAHIKESKSYHNVEVIEIVTFKRKKSVQLILCRETDSFSLINKFDLDYLRCYFHKANFYITRKAKKAHESRTVTLTSNCNKTCIDKAIIKGFDVHDDEWILIT